MSGSDAEFEDLLRITCAELANQESAVRTARARQWLERARAQAPRDPRVLWCDYRMAWLEYDLPAAISALRALRELRPDEPTVGLALAFALAETAEDADARDARALLRDLLALPRERTGAWRMTVLHRLAQLLLADGAETEAAELLAEMQELEARGVVRPGLPAHEPGTLGAVPPHSAGSLAWPRPTAGAEELRELPLRGAETARAARVVQLLPQRVPSEALSARDDADELSGFEPRAAIVAHGPEGVGIGTLQDGLSHALDGPIDALEPLDRDNIGAARGPIARSAAGDQSLDLVVERRGALELLEFRSGAWSAQPLGPALAGAAQGCAPLALDYDHDGDLDLLARPAARLLRNDGLDGTGGLHEVGAAAGLPALSAGDWRAISEDFDRDNDVDVLFVRVETAEWRLASNERGGRYSDQSASLPALTPALAVLAADFDGDAWTDLAVLERDQLVLHTRTPLGDWRSRPIRVRLPAPATSDAVAADWDLDGALDLLWPCASHPCAALLAPGMPQGAVPRLVGPRFASPRTGPARLCVADLDADRDLDLLRTDESGVAAWIRDGAPRGIALSLQGHKDNARGVGAIVELRAGLRYRRLYYRGQPELVGFGDAPLDVVRVTWPNGVVQSHFDLPAGSACMVVQRAGLVGSCPFLYAWNGSTYEFVTDVLGTTPLGLPIAPGVLVPPDHDEYVLVRGEQLTPRDGVFELQLTEELREVTYLDAVRLEAVDHPGDVEVFPNERFSFPPFPQPHTHTLRDPLSPLRALDQDGRDWARELARDDRVLAVPFEPLAGPYLGLATEHTLELGFDAERTRPAPGLRLFLNGWFYWTDASVNLAVAAHPDLEFAPPTLYVPCDTGGWRDCGSIGFPAGKAKTMVVDLSGLIDPADPRILLRSTLRLGWDSIRLAVDADDAALITTPVQLTGAHLWQRGFSRIVPHPSGFGEWFAWDEREPLARWNQHPGMYTRLGEVGPLLGDADDRFAILGAGDALRLSFSAAGLPDLAPGWRRDYLLYLDGWAKDRDPNTLAADFVEPLPFHGMSGYPYGPGESFPDGEEHRRWRREWNTRAATRWIPPLTPAR
ncbi:MAG: CRTAC1 family protein [Planctomycetes bacterium]|nr:CRTAC1 family protein [Planctomycetota bacterium]